jgi:hypothetical protein
MKAQPSAESNMKKEAWRELGSGDSALGGRTSFSEYGDDVLDSIKADWLFTHFTIDQFLKEDRVPYGVGSL